MQINVGWQYEVWFVVMCSEESAMPAVFQKTLLLFSIPMNCTGEENCEKNKSHKVKPLNMSKLSSRIKVFHCLLIEPSPPPPPCSPSSVPVAAFSYTSYTHRLVHNIKCGQTFFCWNLALFQWMGSYSILKFILLIQHGISGVICCMPFKPYKQKRIFFLLGFYLPFTS